MVHNEERIAKLCNKPHYSPSLYESLKRENNKPLKPFLRVQQQSEPTYKATYLQNTHINTISQPKYVVTMSNERI